MFFYRWLQLLLNDYVEVRLFDGNLMPWSRFYQKHWSTVDSERDSNMEYDSVSWGHAAPHYQLATDDEDIATTFTATAAATRTYDDLI